MKATGKPLRVLLIEDNPAEADLIRDMLGRSRREAFELEHFDRLRPGLDRLEQGGIDIVLLDFSLPDSSGLPTFARTRECAPSVPIIILTNLDDEDLAGRAVREGAQDYLIKRQVDGTLLVRAIRYAIERKSAEEALRESEERYALAVRGANDGIWDWSLVTNEAYFSPRWKLILGYGEDEIEDRIEAWFSRVHRDDIQGLQSALDRCLSGGDPHFEHEHRVSHRDGRWMWVLSRGSVVRDALGRPYRMAGSLTDVSERKRVEEQILHDAFHDALTQLPNRSLFVDRLGLALEQARRRKDDGFGVLFLDIDRFKNVNDSLGHSVGDELLLQFARRLATCLRPGDTVARLGGDEFAVLLTDIATAGDATRIAERILEALSESFIIDSHEVVATASIGIALGSTGYKHPTDVLRDADTAMYRAKAAGRACYQVFDTAMHRSVVALLKMEMDLRRAVEREEFVMHYQPIVALNGGRIVGFEGLVRWVHPERGLVYPRNFIAIAEETGLIVPIGWLALREVCRQVRQWQDEFPLDPPLYASVNVSGKLFAHNDIVKRVEAVLGETGLPPQSLRLEVTESVLMDHADAALKALAELRELGVEFSIDDFGTGFSSLTYLQRFSYDTLKIDRTFIADIDHASEGGVIVQTIVALGRMLGMNVVAEGVETPAQLERLREMHCPHAQGFWFSKPVDRASAQSLLLHAPVW